MWHIPVSLTPRLALMFTERHIRDHGAGVPPLLTGQMSNVPSALGPVLVTTTQLDQHLGMTGGSSKPDVKEQFRTAIEGSPFEAVRWPRAVHVYLSTQ